ncbi:protein-tyrosine kinase [Bifidobacterium sp. UTBIF-78]|nr:protein-tyrosine kinase [Bifidobacterium sp. UTBIF-78]
MTIDVLGALKKHFITAIVTLVVVCAAAAAYTFTRTPMYTATSELLATYRTSASSTTGSAGNELNSGASYINSQIQTYPQLVKTESVLQPVIDDLGLKTTVKELAATVTASNPSDTMLVDISVENADPKTASTIANAVAESLKKQVTSTLYSDEGDKIVSPVNLTVVQQAYVPASPSSPNVKMNLAIGVLVGVVFGLIAAVIKDSLDTRIRHESDVTALVDAPILGSIRRNDLYHGKAPAVISKPASREAEEVRRLRTNLSFILPGTPCSNVIVVTSAGPSEGKTTISVNMATAFAESGSKVLLIDADVRNPSVGKQLDLEDTVGLTHLITNEVSSQEAIQKYWKQNFHVLPAGAQRINPSILLNSHAMKALIDQVSEAYDYVIVDTAPMRVSNDAVVFAKEGPQLMFVVGLGVAEKRLLRKTVQELDTLDVKPVGIAIDYAENDNMQKTGYYYYGDSSKDRNGSSGGVHKAGRGLKPGASTPSLRAND